MKVSAHNSVKGMFQRTGGWHQRQEGLSCVCERELEREGTGKSLRRLTSSSTSRSQSQPRSRENASRAGPRGRGGIEGQRPCRVQPSGHVWAPSDPLWGRGDGKPSLSRSHWLIELEVWQCPLRARRSSTLRRSRIYCLTEPRPPASPEQAPHASVLRRSRERT